MRVREQVDRLEALINDLLDVSRIQQGQLELRLSRINLGNLARAVLERFREGGEIGSAHQVRIVEREPVYGIWDAERLDQVVTNLLSNALKYSPEGGEVIIEVIREDDQVLLEVSDEGLGIPAEDMPALFRPFSRRRQNPANITGTGLGLFIVRQIVLQHGGEIDVESQEGRGSRFIIRLPIDSSPAKTGPETERESRN